MFADNKIKIATWNLLWRDFDYMDRVEEASLWLKDVDIVCMQEVRKDSKNYVGSLLAEKLNLKISSDVTFSYELTHESESEPIETHLVILSKYDSLESGTFETDNQDYKFVAYAVLDTPHRPTLIITTHLQWKADREYERLVQAKGINSFAVDKEIELEEKYGLKPIVMLAGDLNTEPKSQTIQYLTGMYADSRETQTYWVDSWKFLKPEDNGYTTKPKSNNLAYNIAADHVTDPNLVPGRRIDYILVKGWVYGSPGHPIKIDLLGVEPRENRPLPSDHYGLKLEIWNPPTDD